jgi:hypothetical protein
MLCVLRYSKGDTHDELTRCKASMASWYSSRGLHHCRKSKSRLGGVRAVNTVPCGVLAVDLLIGVVVISRLYRWGRARDLHNIRQYTQRLVMTPQHNVLLKYNHQFGPIHQQGTSRSSYCARVGSAAARVRPPATTAQSETTARLFRFSLYMRNVNALNHSQTL